MAFLSYSYTASQVIQRAGALNSEPGVEDLSDTRRVALYYAALNEFLQSHGRSREWSWLRRRGAFATVANQYAYSLRLQARGSVAFSGVAAEADLVTISGRGYEFTSGTPAVGDVAVEIGTTAAECAANLADAINGDATRGCQADDDNTTCYLYWSGDDGDGETVVDTTDSGSVMTATNFSLSMPDFSSLLGRPSTDNTLQLEPFDPADELAINITGTGYPRGYAMSGGMATMQLYSASLGPPDDIYLVRLQYQARPSAVLPDGSGDLTFPEEFQDVLPHATLVLLKAGKYEESALYGDQWLSRRLAELERWQVDRTGPSFRPRQQAFEDMPSVQYVEPPLLDP